MKVVDGKLVPEYEVDQKAIDYLSQHIPFFAVANSYVIQAFLAGYEQARKDLQSGGLLKGPNDPQ